MGERGPMPKRTAERRRRNKTSESGDSLEVTRVEVDEAELEKEPVGALPTPKDWDETAAAVYDSLKRSGMRIFYEPSDWAQAYLLCEQIDKHLKPQVVMGPEGAVLDGEGDIMMRVVPMPGSTLSAIIKGFTALGMAEGDRRRMKIELERGATAPTLPEGAGANVTSIRKNRLTA